MPKYHRRCRRRAGIGAPFDSIEIRSQMRACFSEVSDAVTLLSGVPVFDQAMQP